MQMPQGTPSGYATAMTTFLPCTNFFYTQLNRSYRLMLTFALRVCETEREREQRVFVWLNVFSKHGCQVQKN